MKKTRFDYIKYCYIELEEYKQVNIDDFIKELQEKQKTEGATHFQLMYECYDDYVENITLAMYKEREETDKEYQDRLKYEQERIEAEEARRLQYEKDDYDKYLELKERFEK